MKKRILSFILVLVMTLGFLPTITFAETKTYGDLTYEINNGEIRITGCDKNVTTVEIPAEIEGYPVTSIGNYAFRDCSNLTSIAIPDGVTSIGSGAFHSCSSLTSIIIPDGVTFIGDWAFGGCSSLTSITIPDGVTYIGDYAFIGCTSLTSITIPNGVTSIGDETFRYCSSLTSITIPDGVMSIGYSAFAYCSSLTSITIPDGVTSIGGYAFHGCSSLTSITISDGVTSIGGYAFAYCSSLTSITIPNSVTSIGGSAFEECSSLTSITIPDGVTSIGGYSFAYCSRLKKALLPKQMIMVGERTFVSSGIKVLYIPKEITLIKNGAFDNTDIKYVYYGGSEADKQNLTVLPNNDSLNNAIWVYNATGLPECQYDNVCDTECNICGEKRTVPVHVYTNNCDKDCNECGATRITTHSFGEYVYNGDASEKADGTKTRTCSICGHKETITATGTKWKASFTDIKTKDFYYKPTLWAVANNITTGTSKTTFSPDEACTRGQIVTFLWRAAGCPEPTTTNMPFTDVGSKAFYRKAVLWAVENGITSGTSKTTFSPNEPCTRGQIATFLWRAKGKPTPTSTNMPFNDVAKKDFYYKAVLWAVENKITSGTSKTTFAPNDSCTRGQIVTFLYRAYN